MSEHDMLCNCSTDGLLKSESMRRKALVALNLPAQSDLPWGVMLSLVLEHAAKVYVDVDQWFGVSVVADQFSEYVECDNPLDGIVYLWFELEKTRSVTRKIVQSSSHDALFAMLDVRIKTMSNLEDIINSHLQSCNDCKCEFVEELKKSKSDLLYLIDSAWGPDFDVAKSFYGVRDDA